MSLKFAHEGYEYQDLLISYFILNEIVNESGSSFHIDKKLFQNDVFDDLTIVNSNGIFKKQIKYSNDNIAHVLGKIDLSSGNYQLALDDLFFSWNQYINKNDCSITLCLAWESPTDDLNNIMDVLTSEGSFTNRPTSLYQINGSNFWPNNATPPASWIKFNKSLSKINRDDFISFLQSLKLELNLPKFNNTFYNPGELESIVLQQLEKIGLGSYPNDHRSIEEFALSLVSLVKRCRSTGNTIDTEVVFKEFNLKTDYGSIHQKFPVIDSQNISTNNFYKNILNKLESENKIILTGEPGSGKSWFVENLKKYASKKDIRVVRHLCYTDLEDSLQQDRIQTKVFYGNLVNEILNFYPELKDVKEKRYASDLKELNTLLLSINKKTILIIDGIDHIDRVYHFKNLNNELNKNEIDIIGAIRNIQTSDFVKILIVSQPILELESIEGYKKESIPKWTKSDIQKYLKRNKIEDFQPSEGDGFSKFLLDKSSGNPLYLKYLVSEADLMKCKDFAQLNLLPSYNGNLNTYYQYIISKLNLKEQLPRILAGVNFSLTKQELKEITGEENDIEEGLKLIEPVIKQNVSQSGYIIYHESFRRYIIDQLKANGVSLEKNIFNPILNWFEEKGFFEYSKSFRYYFQYVYELNPDKIFSFIQKDFVINSVYHGHSWNSISNNYLYLLKVALKKKEIPKIILVNEINKALSTTEDEFYDNLVIYLESLGCSRGFKHVADYLSYEGNPTLGLKSGVAGCYLCSNYGISAPWDLYKEFFDDKKKIELVDFKFFVGYYIIKQDSVELISFAKRIKKGNAHNYAQVFKSEITQYANQEFVEYLKLKSNNIKSLLESSFVNKSKRADINRLSDEILTFEYISERESMQIRLFWNTIASYSNDLSVLNEIESKFKNRNWFANWIVFLIKSEILNSQINKNYSEVKAILSILIYDTEPFKGKPRTCDLYYAEELIYESISKLLSHLKPSDNWEEIIDILKKLSNNTSTHFQKSLGGPLTTPKFIKLLVSLNNVNNRKLITKNIEEELKDKEGHHLHTYIAEYCFQLSKMYSIVKEEKLSLDFMKKGVQYLLGYTFRKDLTIEDLMDSILSINKAVPEMGKTCIKKLKTLVDSVIAHTDGKGTKHLPVDWFNNFAEIDIKSSAIYLREELIQTQYDWRLEKSLQHLLEKSGGTINPVVEILLAQTFILENTETFLSACIRIVKNTSSDHIVLSNKLISNVFEKAKRKTSQGFSELFIKDLKESLKMVGIIITSEFKNIKKETKYKHNNKNKIKGKKTDLRNMDLTTLTNYITDNELTQADVNSLVKTFEPLKSLSEDTKKLVSAFYNKTLKYRSNEVDIAILFKEDNDLALYYWISRYINDYDGWFNSLVNIEALKKACSINKERSIELLIEELYEKLNIRFSKNLSANLINGLVAINFDSNIILESWNNLYDAIDYRLPSKENYDWDKALANDLEMTEEEIFICILLLRFKSYTSERYQLTLSGVSYLIESEPIKMIKPLKWFMVNQNSFKKSIVLSVIQLIYEYSKSNPKYARNFKAEFDSMYPTNYFLIDLIIEILFNKPKRKLLMQNTQIQYPIGTDEIGFFMKQTTRHSKIYSSGIEIENVFGKVKATYSTIYPFSDMDIYANRRYSLYLSNLYFSDYLLEIINQDLYYDLYQFDERRLIIEDLKINVKLLVAQRNSVITRPKQMLTPTKTKEKYSITHTIDKENKWVRIAHYECELYEKASSKLEECHVYGAIKFDANRNEFPLYVNEINIWEHSTIDMFTPIIHFFYKKDSLEKYKVLWVNSYILNRLGIEVNKLSNSIVGRNKEGEVVLKYGNWNTNYIGDGDFSSLSDEIPRLEGAELLMREDCYKSLCKIFKEAPSYHTLKA